MQAARSLAVAAAAGIVAAAAFAAPTTAAGTPSPPSVGSLSPHAGSTAGGVRVTVLGTGFRHVSGVYFGTRQGTGLRVASPRKLLVTAPARRAGTVDVRVLTNAGFSARVAADHFTFVPPPAVTEVAPSTGELSGGNRVTVTGAHFRRVTGVSFGDTSGTHVRVVSTHRLRVTVPPRARAGTVHVRVTTRYGRSRTSIADEYGYLARALSWGRSTAPESWITQSDTLSCPTTTYCLATSRTGTYTVLDHGTWSHPAPYPRSIAITSAACGSTAFCVGTGDHTVSTFDGTTWSRPQLLDASSEARLGSVSCTSPEFCMAVDDRGHAFAWDGASWSAVADYVDYYAPLPVVACASPTMCVTNTASRWGGASWVSVATPAAFPLSTSQSMTCVSITYCLAIVADGRYVIFDGTSWLGPNTAWPTSSIYNATISCVTQSFCVSTGEDSLQLSATTLTNGTWTTPVVIDTHGASASTECADIDHCEVVDGNWDGTGVGASNIGNVISYRSTGWSPPKVVIHYNHLVAVSCGAATTCSAIDYRGNVLRFDGKQWSSPRRVDTMGHPMAISCASAAFCALVGDTGEAVIRTSAGWQAPHRIEVGYQLNSVSCPTVGFCMAVDQRGRVIAYRDGAWGRPRAIAEEQYLQSVSCASPTYCVAAAARVYVYNGSSWTELPRDQIQFNVMSCFGVDTCVAASQTGGADEYVRTLVGTSWAGPQRTVDGFSWYPYYPGPDTISCTTVDFCVVGNFNGGTDYRDLVQVNAAGESVRVSIPDFAGIMSVSCASNRMCVALAAYSGAVVVGRR